MQTKESDLKEELSSLTGKYNSIKSSAEKTLREFNAWKNENRVAELQTSLAFQKNYANKLQRDL